jgi:hypothetical protein
MGPNAKKAKASARIGSVAAEPEGESKMNSRYREIARLANGTHLASGHCHRYCDLFRSNGASRRSYDQLGWQVHQRLPELRALLGFSLRDC